MIGARFYCFCQPSIESFLFPFFRRWFGCRYLVRLAQISPSAMRQFMSPFFPTIRLLTLDILSGHSEATVTNLRFFQPFTRAFDSSQLSLLPFFGTEVETSFPRLPPPWTDWSFSRAIKYPFSSSATGFQPLLVIPLLHARHSARSTSLFSLENHPDPLGPLTRPPPLWSIPFPHISPVGFCAVERPPHLCA